MTPSQIALVRDSFAKLTPSHESVAARFYENLFDIDPSLKHLFTCCDMRVQCAKLVVVIGTIVNSLDDLEPILGSVRDLGRRHVRYGVQEKHYVSCGKALLETLHECFGPAFEGKLCEAWAAAYAAVSSAMMEAARTPTPKAA